MTTEYVEVRNPKNGVVKRIEKRLANDYLNLGWILLTVNNNQNNGFNKYNTYIKK